MVARLVWQRMLCLAAVVCLLVPAWVASAQEKSADACRRRTVVVNVLDKDGHQVLGLTAEGFRGEYRGDPVKILSVTWDTGPRRVVLVFDGSRPMAARREDWIGAKQLATDLLVYGPQSFDFALVLSFEREEERVPFELGRQAALSRIADLPEDASRLELGWGRAPIAQAVADAVDLLGSPKVGDAVYLITATHQYLPSDELAAAQQRLSASGVRLYVLLLLGESGQWGWGPYLAPGELKYLTQRSGGEFLLAVNQLDRKVHELYDRIRALYRVEVELPRAVGKSRKWKLEVVDAQGNRRKDVDVLYPHHVVPCVPQSGATATGAGEAH